MLAYEQSMALASVELNYIHHLRSNIDYLPYRLSVINHYSDLSFTLFIASINYNPLEALRSYYIKVLKTQIRILYYYFHLLFAV